MIPHLEPITTPVRVLNERILDLICKPGPLNDAEWEEITDYEKECEE